MKFPKVETFLNLCATSTINNAEMQQAYRRTQMELGLPKPGLLNNLFDAQDLG